jgi:hypothetical protein
MGYNTEFSDWDGGSKSAFRFPRDWAVVKKNLRQW